MSGKDCIDDLIDEFQRLDSIREVQPKNITITKSMIGNDDDIPSIPDMEEYNESNMNLPVSSPVKMTTFKEHSLQNFTLQEIDLSPLLNKLTADCTTETDIIWTIDSLLSELIQSI